MRALDVTELPLASRLSGLCRQRFMAALLQHGLIYDTDKAQLAQIWVCIVTQCRLPFWSHSQHACSAHAQPAKQESLGRL